MIQKVLRGATSSSYSRGQASEDEIGLKVKLANTNTTSRILPIRIHDLDTEDLALVENETGPLRSVDFIFKSIGVNRPLMPADNPDKNQNKTFYRDQVNKVANCVKEIIGGLKGATKQVPNSPSRSGTSDSSYAQEENCIRRRESFYSYQSLHF